jgi:hypothetical protein
MYYYTYNVIILQYASVLHYIGVVINDMETSNI